MDREICHLSRLVHALLFYILSHFIAVFRPNLDYEGLLQGNFMRTMCLSLSLALLSILPANATNDPRNAAEYRILFDLVALGKSEIVKGYGAYVQIYSPAAASEQIFRYCDNFDGKGIEGRPNFKRQRMKFVPVGVKDETAYDCREFTLKEAKSGVPLIKLGNRSFFEMQSKSWSSKEGGEIDFKFARTIPLLGTPTYRTLLIRATREGDSLAYKVEAILPRAEVHSTSFLEFTVSGSGLGIPNGITGLRLNPGTRLERSVDPDTLEPAQVKRQLRR